MSHAVFTVVTPLTAWPSKRLSVLLRRMERNHAANGLVDFTSFRSLHFASITLFPPDGPLPPLLVFEHNVDGGLDEHLDALSRRATAGLLRIYGFCVDAPGRTASPRELFEYMRSHVVKPSLHHVGVPYRRADAVAADEGLRERLEREADLLAQRGTERQPEAAWAELRARVQAPRGRHRDWSADVDPCAGTVTWRRRPEPKAATRLRRYGVAVLLAAAAAAAPLAWLLHRLWPAPATRSVAIILVFTLSGWWTALLLGWPISRLARTAAPGETPEAERRALRDGWRHTVNIWVWFAVVGWLVSLVPTLFSLAGFSAPGSWHWAAVLAMTGLVIVVLAQAIGRWPLPTPDLAHPSPGAAELERVMAEEDRHVVNHMSAMVVLRPGWVRSASLRLLLFVLEHTWFHTYLADVRKGKLFDLSTVHFAQWVMLGRGRYMFLSNYDHTWTRYLDDFATISFGLARLWGQGARTPGLSNLERFKDFGRTWMVPHAVWYRALPDTALTQVWNNEVLRRALLADQARMDASSLLGRLVAAGKP